MISQIKYALFIKRKTFIFTLQQSFEHLLQKKKKKLSRTNFFTQNFLKAINMCIASFVEENEAHVKTIKITADKFWK
jgi:hypothetical protein